MGVGLFFLLSGYFLIYKKASLRKVKKVIAQSYFYGWLYILFFLVLCFLNINVLELNNKDVIKYIINSVFIPFISGDYWFISAYVILVLVSPIVNEYIIKLNKKSLLFLLFLFWLLGYVVSGITNVKYFELQKAIFFYLAGAYLRLFGKNKMKSRKGYAFISVAMWIIIVLLYLLKEYIGVNNAKIYNVSSVIINMIINYTIVPLIAICIFVYFESLELKYNKTLNYIAGTTLGIYLIHESLIGRNFIWYNLLKVDVMFEKTLFPFYALIDIVIVFVVCSIIDMVRMKIMKLMDRILFNLKGCA